jgi:serine/threonine protein kinase
LEGLSIITVTAPQPNPSQLHLLTVGKRLSEKTHPYVDRLVQLFNAGINVKGTPPKHQLIKLQDLGPTALFQSQDASAIPFALFIKSPAAVRMSMPERVQMLACLASALSYLEAHGCCHALLQPSLVVISETQGPIVQGIDSCLAMMQRPASTSVTVRMEPSYVSGRLAQLKAVHSWAVPRYYAPELLLSPALELDQFWPYSATFSEATLEGMHAYSWASLAIYALAGTPPGDGLTNENFLLEQRLGSVPRLHIAVSSWLFCC